MQVKGGFFSLPRPLLVGLATLFAAATVLYSAIWMYYIRLEPKAQLGIGSSYSAQTRSMRVTRVPEGSAAEQAGLRPEDRIVAINGRPLDNYNPYYDAVYRGQPGDVVELTVERPGAASPIVLQTVLQPRPAQAEELTPTQTVAIELIRSFPVLFLVVGLPVLFLRLDDRNAWLLALLFAGLIACAPLPQGAIHPALRGSALAYHVTLARLTPALFYCFFAVFPVASPLDRRLPWLKSLILVAAAAVLVPLGLWVNLAATSYPLLDVARRVDQVTTRPLVIVYYFGAPALGLVALVWNSLRAPTAEARRRTRVIVWGTVVGFTPALLLQAAAIYASKEYFEFPFWVWAPTVLALFLLPLSFAYAVVKHRVLEIPLLLRRSARYLLVQRGFTVFLNLLSLGITVLFAVSFARFLQPRTEAALPGGIAIGAAFGILLVWAGRQVQKRVTVRIDRAFFRSAYDARLILQDLAEKTRTAANRQELAALLERHLKQALHPKSLAIYLETSQGRLSVERGRVPPELETIPTALPVLAEIERRGQPWDAPPEESGSDEPSILAPLKPECLVPILGRDARLTGLVALGLRLSEEPYSGEDKRLLASVASQAGIALESIRLAEQMAERMEAERRAAFEMTVAKQVQDKLFPQKMPPLATLEYAGACVQARTVGGDYYDFLDLGPGQIGLVLADIAGKGMSGALLMANLQANLRSQYAVALDDLPRLLYSVNRLFYESTAPSHYATFFFGHYEDASRRLCYANCGHIPPLLLRGDGAVERLTATATVLGLFEDWECALSEVQLTPGDTLVVFSDGITEAMSDAGEEFGVARLLETLRASRHLPVPALLSAIVNTVAQFSGREQEDDLTLVVARPR